MCFLGHWVSNHLTCTQPTSVHWSDGTKGIIENAIKGMSWIIPALLLVFVTLLPAGVCVYRKADALGCTHTSNCSRKSNTPIDLQYRRFRRHVPPSCKLCGGASLGEKWSKCNCHSSPRYPCAHVENELPWAHVVYLLCCLLTYCAEFLVVIIASTCILAGHPFHATSVHEHHLTARFNQGLVIHSALLNYVNR